MRSIALRLLFLICSFASITAMAAAKTEVRLLLSAEAARPGDTLWAGVEMKMLPGWHTYWKNSGDSGSPTEITWQLPAGITAGEIHWPVPGKDTATAGDLTLVTYVYGGEIILLVPLQLSSNLPPGEVKIAAQVEWQECLEVCILGTAQVETTLSIGPESVPSFDAARLDAAKTHWPKDGSHFSTVAAWKDRGSETERTLEIQFTPERVLEKWDFFPDAGKNFSVDGLTQEPPTPSGKVSLVKKITKEKEASWPTQLSGILVNGEGEAATGYTVQFPISETPVGRPVSETGAPSLALILLFAFLGGLILNVMPCVLPVIALKIFSFVSQSQESPARVRSLGLVYGIGVLVSFVGLAVIAILAQKAGGLASWGMVLQNQLFRVVLTVVVTLVACNLFGLYEVVLSGRVMGAAGELAAKEGWAGAFFNGVLATVLATPCTAPFLGLALAFAFTQPPAIILLVFLMVGTGLAAPFVLLCGQPGWLKLLPKPGAWMEKFKIAMGFPMLATAVWLFWFTAPRFGKTGVLWLGLFLVALAAAAWVWGEFVQRGSRRRGWAMAISLILAIGGYVYALEGKLNWRSPVPANPNAVSLQESSDGIAWQAWSPEAVTQARAAGRPVLVDFTADNCLNCQLNKASSLEIPATRALLQEINAVALLGDFTDANPQIAAELQRYGRPGVPLVLVYSPRPDEPPQVLPTILTPGIVRDALQRAAKSQ